VVRFNIIFQYFSGGIKETTEKTLIKITNILVQIKIWNLSLANQSQEPLIRNFGVVHLWQFKSSGCLLVRVVLDIFADGKVTE
jgi:hypothetical protein